MNLNFKESSPNMRTKIVFVALCAGTTVMLAGCMTPQSAKSMSSYSLCERLMYGMDGQRSIALNELRGRNTNCDQYVNLIIASKNAEQANTAALLGGLAGAAAITNANQQYYAPAAPATNNYYIVPRPSVNITPPPMITRPISR
jgi:hypothetical protein